MMENLELETRIAKLATKILEYPAFKKRYVELDTLKQQELMSDCLEYTQEHCQKSFIKYGEKAFEERMLFYPIDSYFRQHLKRLK